MAQIQVPVKGTTYACTCGGYTGTASGVATHRSKTRCGGEAVIQWDVPDPEPGAAAAGDPDVVGDEIRPAGPGDQRGAKPIEDEEGPAHVSRFKESLSIDASLHAVYDIYRTHFGFEGDFSAWTREMCWDYLSLLGWKLTLVIPDMDGPSPQVGIPTFAQRAVSA